MSRLHNAYQSVKNRGRRSGGILVASVGLALTTLMGCYDTGYKGPPLDYKGTINGQEITYHEDDLGIGASGQNRMIISRGGITYTLIDNFEETRIRWEEDQKPDFEKDLLENVHIESEKTRRSYYSKAIN